MGDLEEIVPPLFKGTFTDMIKTEELLAGAAQSLLEDEIKRYIREKLEENPDLKREMKKAMEEYLEARLGQVAAQMKIMTLAAKLGILLIPDDMREKFSGEMLKIFEKDVSAFFEKAL